MKKVVKALIPVFVLLIFFLIFSAKWALKTFSNVTIDEVIYHLMAPIDGTNMDTIRSFIFEVIPITIIVATIVNLYLFYKSKTKVSFEFSFKDKIKSIQVFPLKIKTVYKGLIVFVFGFVLLYFTTEDLEIVSYIKAQLQRSLFIEENYVDPSNVKITFPEEKNNLIYICLESMENSYKSKNDGGVMDSNLISELTSLEDGNISFKPGIRNIYGTTYTIGSMVAQTSGIPIKIAVSQDGWNARENILPGAITIGNVLDKEGYNQMIMFGSDGAFASRQTFFEKHGNYKVWDLYSAIDEGKMTEEDRVFWGFDDTHLFTYAKEKVLELAKSDKPFNLTLLTVNTHAEDGWLEESCAKKYDDQYSNVISCSSSQVYQFVNWIKKQDFYKNTTIVLVGDHVTMDKDYFADIDKSYVRTIYNVIINPKNSVKDLNVNRSCSIVDMFPTTLASLGAEIEGNRLGLGVNLFSSEQSMLEKYDYNYVNEELKKTSIFYNNRFILNKKYEDSLTKEK